MSTDQELLAEIGTETATPLGLNFLDLVVRERVFLTLLGIAFLTAGIVYPAPQVAMWVGFGFAAYSAVANDSIQTLGTFLSSNGHRPWWVLWLFAGGVFLVVETYGWIHYGGDVSYERLSAKGFATAPTHFAFLQVAAPLFLAIITRMRMPVSTTFLILTSFSTSTAGVNAVLTKSLSGYGVAFVAAIVLWTVLGPMMDRAFRGKAHPAWYVAQWFTTGTLWSVWLMQDASNIAVYLPRSLSTGEFIGFAGTMVAGLGLIFYLKGDRIQQVVSEKSSVIDVRHATVIDGVYAVLLYGFKAVSTIPMSTTWVFLGLLAGREIGLNLFRPEDTRRKGKRIAKLIIRDVTFAGIGLAVSLLIAVSVNPALGHDLFGIVWPFGPAH